MSTRRYDGPERMRWRWWKRVPIRLGAWGYNVVVGPFLTKLPDGTINASMTRIAVAAFTIVEVYRLRPQFQTGAGLWLVPVIGWPDAFLAFCILFALPIDGALTNAKPSEVLSLLGKPFSRAGEALEQGASMTTTLTQAVEPGPTTPPPAPPVTTEDPPHEWADGDPHAGLG